MRSKLVLAAVGCLALAVMAHAQTSDVPSDAMQPPAAPYGATMLPAERYRQVRPSRPSLRRLLSPAMPARQHRIFPR
jgi:hypothetical protein